MPKESAPAFQFYVKEWRSSRPIMRMTYAQRGMYLEMLLEQWENHSLPDSPDACADLIGGTAEEWREAWPVLRARFVDRRRIGRPKLDDLHTHGRIHNLRLERVRKELKLFQRWGRDNARKGGISRAVSASRGKDGTYLPAGLPAKLDQLPSREPATASASATASAVQIRRVECSKRDHLFCGRHFHVSYAQQRSLEEGLAEDFIRRFDFTAAYARWDREKPQFDNTLRFLRGKIQAEAAGVGGGDLYDKLPHVYQCATCGEIHEGTEAQMRERTCLGVAL